MADGMIDGKVCWLQLALATLSCMMMHWACSWTVSLIKLVQLSLQKGLFCVSSHSVLEHIVKQHAEDAYWIQQERNIALSDCHGRAAQDKLAGGNSCISRPFVHYDT